MESWISTRIRVNETTLIVGEISFFIYFIFFLSMAMDNDVAIMAVNRDRKRVEENCDVQENEM